MTTQKKYNQASLLLHSVIDNLDDSHFTYDEESGKIQFNIGKVSRNSSFSHINMVIQQSGEDSIQPAKMRDSDMFVVVVKTKSFPESIKDVDEFLESSKISVNVIKALSKIINHAPSSNDGDTGHKSDYEKEQFYNSRDNFEKMYQQAVRKMGDKLESLEKSIEELENKIESTGIESRKATYKMAIKRLKNDVIGDSVSKFKSTFMKILDEIDPKFKENLNSDNRKRLNSRIEQFYSEIE